MDQIYLTNRKIEEIRKCAIYAQALGQAMASLAFYSNDEKTVIECCQELGEIISEYMDAIIIGIDDESKSTKELLCSGLEDRYDDMAKWSSYLKILSKTISSLSFFAGVHPDPRLEGPLQMTLSDITSDYADLIQDSVDEASEVLSDYFRMAAKEEKPDIQSIIHGPGVNYDELEDISLLADRHRMGAH